MRGSKDPSWLQPLWEKKRADTAKRVERAIKELIRRKAPVTLEGIRNAVTSLYGVSISTKTIHPQREGECGVPEAPDGKANDEGPGS